MALSVRRSSPAGSLGNAAIDYSEKCTELWIASAFVSPGAVDKVLTPARKAAARVLLLTGTFGRHTRKDTFQKLLRLERLGVETRIWESTWVRATSTRRCTCGAFLRTTQWRGLAAQT